jgi:VWFA-related protein
MLNCKPLTLVLLAGMAAAQAPPAPSGPRMILLDVRVTNDQGPVRGLTKDDFILQDKGKKQTLAVFEVTEAGRLSMGAPLPAGVASNRLDSKGQVQNTATIVLYDRINSGAEDQAFVRAQILRLLAGLKEDDRVGFYSLGFTLKMVRDFNEDAGPLAKAAQALLQSGAAPESFTPEEKVLFRDLADAVSPMQQLQNQPRVNITYPAFESIGRHLSGVMGRKNLLWITSVFPLTYGNSVDRRKNDQMEVDAFKANLTDANISLYPVDPGGTGASFNQTPGAPVSSEGSLLPGALRNPAGTSSIANTDTSLTGNQTMQLLADATGGRAYRNANDITPALQEVTAAADYTYTLGFYPDAKTLDGKFHDLKVTLVKKPATDKAKVTHRKQYLAWAPDTPAATEMRPSMTDLVEEPLLSGGVGLMGMATSDPAKPGAIVLDIRISAVDIRFEPRADKYVASFDVALSPDGGNVLSAKTYTPQLTAEQLAGVLQNGMDIRESINTGGASGVVRVSLLDKLSGASGGLRIPFTGSK